MALVSPLVTYNSIKINNVDVLLDGNCRASFNSPFNKINVTMTPTNCSLSYYEVRVTGIDDPYDIEVGNLAYWTASVAQNKTHSFTININETLFNKGNGVYRISLYAKSAIDGSWDTSYLLFTVDNNQFVLADGTTFSVLTTREAPSNK